MLICAIDFYGIAFWELFPENTIVTSKAYRDFLLNNHWLRTKMLDLN